MLYSKAADFYYNLWQKWWWKHDIPLARSWIIFCKKRTRSNRKRLSTFSSYFYDKQTTFGTICIPNVQPANEQFGEKKITSSALLKLNNIVEVCCMPPKASSLFRVKSRENRYGFSFVMCWWYARNRIPFFLSFRLVQIL